MNRDVSYLRALEEGTPEFSRALTELARRGEADLSRVAPTVRDILEDVRRNGDAALRRYIERFEGRAPGALLARDYGGAVALASLPQAVRTALEGAAARIRSYHEEQRKECTGFAYERDGVRLASRVTPLERAGVYAPGGKASYPSTVLMCAVPAAVAGVEEIILACPDTTPEVLAACHLAGVSAVLHAGGAQAIAALAYGTESVPRVDKIVGPGNLYVAAAKQLVFGQVSIDGIAGPSEILVVADDTADARLVAADLLSQAEHDEDAYALLLTTDRSLVERVRDELARQLAALPERDASGRARRSVAEASLHAHTVAFVVRDRDELARVADRLAAEHVSVQTAAPAELARSIRRAGALFVGAATPEAAGDYFAGPSHVLPTGGAARFGAPLGVYDFVSRSSIIEYEALALEAQAPSIISLARAEGLEAHARAVEIRLERDQASKNS
ncbi:MAG TPA: histidinol dehydrogenase [Polyangiaceae bacterium]